MITFNPHPFEVLKKDKVENYLITSFNEKIKLLSDSGLDFVYAIDFNKTFANMNADAFVHFLYENFSPSDIVVGYDHFFGKDRKGSFDLLNKYKKSNNQKFHI